MHAIAELLCQLIELFGLPPGDGDGRTLLMQRAGDSSADAAGRAGDERRLAREIEHGVPLTVELSERSVDIRRRADAHRVDRGIDPLGKTREDLAGADLV